MEINEFHGDNVWRDPNGVIWVRLSESVKMQEFAWNLGFDEAVDDIGAGELSDLNPYSKPYGE